MSKEEEIVHDLRDPSAGGEGVVLIVRKGNKYGPAHAGEKVRVDEAELQNRSTMEACMTIEAYEEHLAKQAKKKAEPPKTSQLKATVDAELKRIQQQALEKQRQREAAEAAAPPAVTPQAPAAAKKPKKTQQQ